jgi:hypothetical protein
VRIGQNAHRGNPPDGEPAIAMIGKHSSIPAGMVIEPGAIIATDVIPSDFASMLVRGDDYIQTKRLPNEI